MTSDFSVDIDDIVFLLQYVFGQGPPPNPLENGDVDCSGIIDVDVVVYLLYYVLADGPEPRADCP